MNSGIRVLPLDCMGHSVGKENETTVLFQVPWKPMFPDLSTECRLCGERPCPGVSSGRVILGEQCPFPEGITTRTVLDIPSGRMIVSDDLRPVYHWDGAESGFASFNSLLGQSQVIEHMARLGCAYGPVGNSCPVIYRSGEGHYVIAGNGTDSGDPIAWITTGVWAYSIADYDHWISRGGVLRHEEMVVPVPAGVYEFAHHSTEREFDPYSERPVIFADITYRGKS